MYVFFVKVSKFSFALGRNHTSLRTFKLAKTLCPNEVISAFFAGSIFRCMH